MEPSESEIQDLRLNFFKRCTEDKLISSGTFHQNDVDRAKTDDDWLRRFLMHNENDQKEALNMMLETCNWRMKFGANDISTKTVKTELLEKGSVFAHGRDKDGKALLIFKSKKHVKGALNFEELKKYLVYWMERMERQEKGEMISIFFDMDGASVTNFDTEYIKYIISLFKNYYPHFLNYIIIYEMAWVLNAAFRMIKSWLPPKAIKKIKFVCKSNVKELVEPKYALKSWGGLSDYVYTFDPDESNNEESVPLNQDECKKKVHFADGSPVQEYMSESGLDESISSGFSNQVKLSITPSDLLPFLYEGNDLTGSILLKNEDVQCLSYKIKTTSPKKFRVRPSMGILSPDQAAVVTVMLQTGYGLPGLDRDKFLIMSIPVNNTDISPESLQELWKNSSEEDVSGYKLRCSLAKSVVTDGTIVNGSAAFSSRSSDDQKLSRVTADMMKIQTSVSNLREEVKVIQRQQWIIAAAILFLACIVAYISGNNTDSSRDNHNCWVMNDTKQ